MSTTTTEPRDGLLAALMADEGFLPEAPRAIADTGLTSALIESLIVKHLAIVGTNCVRGISKQICLPFGILEELCQTLRSRQFLAHKGAAPLNDYHYTLTEQGRERAQAAMATCAYVGPAPVPLVDYVLSVDAQTIRAEAPKREQLVKAFADISIDPNLFENLGPG